MKTILVLLTILLANYDAYTQGTLVYDQQASPGNLASGGATIQNQQPMGQSFTPSLSAVGFVQFMFLDSTGNQGATVYINLLSDSITGSVVAATSPVFMPNGFNGITNFFFPSNVSVQSGVEYFFRPVLLSGDNTGLKADIFNYSLGTAIFVGQPSNAGVDFWFREGIVVPEPSSFALLGISALAVFFSRHKPNKLR